MKCIICGVWGRMGRTLGVHSWESLVQLIISLLKTGCRMQSGCIFGSSALLVALHMNVCLVHIEHLQKCPMLCKMLSVGGLLSSISYSIRIHVCKQKGKGVSRFFHREFPFDPESTSPGRFNPCRSEPPPLHLLPISKV